MSDKTQAQLTPWQGFKRYLKNEFPSQAKTFVAECPKILWAFLKDNFWPILMIAVFVWLNRIIPEPTEDFYKIYSLFAGMGFVIAAIISFLSLIFRGNALSHPVLVYSSIIRAFGWIVTFIGMPLLLVRISIAGICAAYQENPQELIISAIALSIFLFFITLGLHWRGNNLVRITRYTEVTNAAMSTVPENWKTGEDRGVQQRRIIIAIHETGHALCYAAFEPLPDELYLEIYDLHESSKGMVYSPLAYRYATNTAQWKMMTCIAGMSAERQMTGKYMLGSASDFRGC